MALARARAWATGVGDAALSPVRSLANDSASPAAAAATATATATATNTPRSLSLSCMGMSCPGFGADANCASSSTSSCGRTLIYGSTFRVCAVCLDEYVHGDTLRVLHACGHCFHAHCIDDWLSRVSACPVCKASVEGFCAPVNNAGAVLLRSHHHQQTHVAESQQQRALQQQRQQHRLERDGRHTAVAVQLFEVEVHASWIEWIRGLIKVVQGEQTALTDTQQPQPQPHPQRVADAG